MNRRSGILLASFMLVTPAAVRAAKSDPKSVIKAVDSALNAAKVDEAAAAFADDAVLTDPFGKTLQGKDQIKAWLQTLTNFHVEAPEYKADGNKVTWDFRVAFEPLRRLGLDAATGTAEAVVQNGKITSFHPSFDELTTLKLDKGLAAANKALTRKAYDAINTRNWNAFKAFLSADAVDHRTPPGTPQGAEGITQFLRSMTAAFPDFKQSIEDMIAEGDKVVTRITATGTMRGDYMGMKATGKTFTITGVDILRFKDGKAVEHWGNEDDMGMMRQLGAARAPD